MLDDESDKDSGHPVCERPQCLISCTTEPTALTGYQACQTSSFRFVFGFPKVDISYDVVGDAGFPIAVLM
jgi:hypothetical protein